MYGYIYKTSNLINNKIYIGQKKSDRFLNERYLGSGKRFKSALKHYGKESFKVELIDTANTKDELDVKEIYWISYYDSTNPSIGYNLSLGGNNFNMPHAWNKGLKGCYTHSDDTKQKMSESRKGHLTSQETKDKISKSNSGKKRTAEQNLANKLRNEGKVWVRKGEKGTTISKELIEDYLQDGWELGRPKYNSTAWNKGLTKETDERVYNYAKKRKDRLNNGESIGFCIPKSK